jgi:hypothetical protein
MADSFLDLPAELQVAVYKFILADSDECPELDVITSLRLCCRQTQQNIDHEFLKVYWEYINAYEDLEKLPGLVLKRPNTIGEAQTLRITLSIEHITQQKEMRRKILQEFIRWLPDFVRELSVSVVPPKDNEAYDWVARWVPDWQYLTCGYTIVSSLLNDKEEGWYKGSLASLQVHWGRRPLEEEKSGDGCPLLEFLDDSDDVILRKAECICVDVVPNEDRIKVLLVFGSYEASQGLLS